MIREKKSMMGAISLIKALDQSESGSYTQMLGPLPSFSHSTLSKSVEGWFLS